MMRYRLLGNSGLRVSEAALGAMTFGDDWGWGAAKDEARKVYDAFREAGGNFIAARRIVLRNQSESSTGEQLPLAGRAAEALHLQRSGTVGSPFQETIPAGRQKARGATAPLLLQLRSSTAL